MTLALIAALPFLGALLPGFAIRAGRSAATAAVAAVTALALALILGHAPAVLRGEVVTTQIDWLPALGLNAHFLLDGLGLLFAILILGIGLLIQLYARFYLAAADPMARFLAFLMLFQGAMLGIVLSDNILLLLVFWELTSLSSFLLIGYWSHLPEGRQGARMALVVTGSGGLAMIAGALMLGHVAGSHDISDMLAARQAIQDSPLYLPALILILLGAFTKSAQFPFHFWLPHAMAAPTPVSAYLHSATMVKAGLYLMARLWPVLAGSEAWFLIVATTGLATMVIAAGIALFKDDLKAILAYSTVSHLGLITFLLGLGTKSGAVAAVFHILCHASFKAALFMVAGIVDHAVHSRDIRRLGGLRRLMPATFALALIATLAMAGVPPLNGFLSKEMALEAAAATAWLGNHWLVPVLASLGAALSVGYALRFLVQGFLGPVRADYPHAPHDPAPGLWLSPALLTLAVVAIGLAPMPLAAPLVDAAAAAVTATPVHAHIALWHGLQSPALWMSVFAFGAGLLLLAGYPRLRARWDATPRPEAKALFDAAMASLVATAARASAGLHDGSLGRMMRLAVLTVAAAGVLAFASGSHLAGARPPTPVSAVAALVWLVLVAAVAAVLRFHRNRLLAILFLGIIGLVVSLAFAYLAAPDLALTQITVEVVTVILLMLALNFLPRHSARLSGRQRKTADAVLAGLVGLGAAALSHAMMRRDAAFAPISGFHLAQSKPGAGGTNAVNTIIVDFRGYDTYGEIIVLGIAALVIFALAEALMARGVPWAALPDQRAGDAGDPHPEMFRVAARFLLPMTMMVGVYLFLRGHNLPGGGFVAGLVFAIGLLMQYIAAGLKWTAARFHLDYHVLIGLGVLVASATGIGSWAAGRPFLTSAYGYFHLPPLEEFELATAMAFDLGVFLCVLGAVMMALDALSRLARRAR